MDNISTPLLHISLNSPTSAELSYRRLPAPRHAYTAAAAANDIPSPKTSTLEMLMSFARIYRGANLSSMAAGYSLN